MTSAQTTSPCALAPEDIWCAIPVYNNARTIADVARRARAQVQRVVVIDDGSTDANLCELLNGLDVHVVRHPANRGKGAALQTALNYARERGGRYLLTLDGDGQHFPEDIPQLLAVIDRHAIVIGRRTEIVGDRPRASRFGQDFSDFWIQVETGVAVRDTQCGFRVYPIEPLAQLPLHSRHYTFEVEVLTRALWAGLHTRTTPIRVSYSEAARRSSSFRPGRDNVRLSWLHARLVLRQLAPIPHQRLVADRPDTPRAAPWHERLRRQNAGPLGLAAAVGLGVLQGIVLWPFGMVPVLYESWRLHLNKVVALASVVFASLLLPIAWRLVFGRHVAPDAPHWALAWFAGTHIISLVVVPPLTLCTYFLAKALRGTAGTEDA
jgi:glycosyltransferase involved in cell wall biosynthesis